MHPALDLENIVNENYGYLERLPGDSFQLTDKLRADTTPVTVFDPKRTLAIRTGWTGDPGFPGFVRSAGHVGTQSAYLATCVGMLIPR